MPATAMSDKDDEGRRDPLPQEPGRQEQDHQRLERPQQHVQAGGDGGQPDQAERVRETRVEETEPAEQRRALGSERDPLTTHEDGQHARLAASWIGRSVNGGISASAALLMTVPTPQQVAARISAARSRGAIDERDMTALRAHR